MKIVFFAKHEIVLWSPGVFTDVLINCGPECHNDQGPGSALGQLESCSTLGHHNLGGEVKFDRWARSPQTLSDLHLPSRKWLIQIFPAALEPLNTRSTDAGVPLSSTLADRAPLHSDSRLRPDAGPAGELCFPKASRTIHGVTTEPMLRKATTG